ncbi:hypothetical protein [Paenibacillus sp. J22TS3]|uniref:hypothetical protein n=1 Tax=Paenibacillus sp. J22TS3 TaxID=2807192 RepID=UPI001B2486C2|nr:hypothetical protein [Paenibacillus sp. J22TS3]GIP24154.1 hypothetical protein J22TS3_44290 [Paenibacillus sp. J22TS3]
MKKFVITSLAVLSFVTASIETTSLIATASSTPAIEQEKNDASKDPWGRAIRTTNLPKNYKDFPYILEHIPNVMYEGKHKFKFGEILTPAQFAKESDYSTKTMSKWGDMVEQYGNQILNVDYRTIDQKWADKVLAVQNQQNIMVRKNLLKYVSWVKKNHIRIEGKLTAEPSTASMGEGNFFMMARFKFKIISYDKNKDYIIYDDWFTNNRLKEIAKNVEYEGFTDIQLDLTTYNGTLDQVKVSDGASINRHATFKKAKR